ncbi:MAG TPA: hypothetical protein VGP19_14100 [Candidatus Acidoferrales bacterium]|jgi:hypothetical protein|nr:hypothetical protein [Candidatus Acidoferrales bacterium]
MNTVTAALRNYEQRVTRTVLAIASLDEIHRIFIILTASRSKALAIRFVHHRFMNKHLPLIILFVT